MNFATFLISTYHKSCQILYHDTSKCNYIKTVMKGAISYSILDNDICKHQNHENVCFFFTNHHGLLLLCVSPTTDKCIDENTVSIISK